MNSEKTRQIDIKDTETLLSYLKNPAGGLRSAYHYTNLESLYQIFSNKTLRFSRMSKMNDYFEREFFCNDHDFFFCLSKSKEDENENFGMWAMYGNLNSKKNKEAKNIGVKIYFPKGTLKQICNENKNLYIYSVAYTNLIDNYRNLNDFTIHVDSYDATIKDFNKEQCSGFLKDTAWRYENEMRLRIPATTENITDKTKDISISDKILQNLKVYPSPIYDVNEIEQIFNESCGNEKIKVNFCENKYRNSIDLQKE